MTKEFYLRRQARRKAKRDKITGIIFIIVMMMAIMSLMLCSCEKEMNWNDSHPTVRYGSMEVK